MKAMNFNKRLVLNKTTIAHLSAEDQEKVHGGGATKPPTRCDCHSADTNCPTRIIVICTTF